MIYLLTGTIIATLHMKELYLCIYIFSPCFCFLVSTIVQVYRTSILKGSYAEQQRDTIEKERTYTYRFGICIQHAYLSTIVYIYISGSYISITSYTRLC